MDKVELEKLSEKGFEQRANRRFGRYAEHEIGKEGASWQPVGGRRQDALVAESVKEEGQKRFTLPPPLRLRNGRAHNA